MVMEVYVLHMKQVNYRLRVAPMRVHCPLYEYSILCYICYTQHYSGWCWHVWCGMCAFGHVCVCGSSNIYIHNPDYIHYLKTGIFTISIGVSGHLFIISILINSWIARLNKKGVWRTVLYNGFRFVLGYRNWPTLNTQWRRLSWT